MQKTKVKIKERIVIDIEKSIGLYGVLVCLYILSIATGVFAVGSLQTNNLESLKQVFVNAILNISSSYNIVYCLFFAIINNLIAIALIYFGKIKKPLLFFGFLTIFISGLSDGLCFRIFALSFGIGGMVCFLFSVFIPSVFLCVCRFKLINISFSQNNAKEKRGSGFIFWSLLCSFAIGYQIVISPILLGMLGRA